MGCTHYPCHPRFGSDIKINDDIHALKGYGSIHYSHNEALMRRQGRIPIRSKNVLRGPTGATSLMFYGGEKVGLR